MKVYEVLQKINVGQHIRIIKFDKFMDEPICIMYEGLLINCPYSEMENKELKISESEVCEIVTEDECLIIYFER